jgi:hypothetical protein
VLTRHWEKIAFIFIILGTYLLFNFNMLNPNLAPVGKYTTDALSLHYPSRFYLFQELRNLRFPFWTEKIYGGFPIFEDAERGYLNIPNIILTFIYGPVCSYKLLHFFHYLLGSAGIYFLCKKRNISLAGYSIFNLVYFFSFYNLVRQQMLNGLMIIYVLPLLIYLTLQLIETKKLRYLLGLVLLYTDSLYWGQFNYIAINLILNVIYYLVSSFKRLRILEHLKFASIGVLIFLILNLPLIMSTGKLFLSGARGQGALDPLEGGFSPALSISAVYPFPLGDENNFVAKIINNEYLFNEVSIYTGIAATILAFLSFLKKKSVSDLLFIGITLFTVVFLAYLKTFIRMGADKLPIINLFRYWGRIYILYTFVIGYLAASYLSTDNNDRINMKNLIYLLPACALFLLSIFLNYKSLEFTRIMQFIQNSGIQRDYIFWSWITIAGATIGVTFLKNSRLKRILLISLVAIDLFVVSTEVRNRTFMKINNLKDSNYDNIFVNERIIPLDEKKIFGNTMLYYKSWGLFGYSAPFEPKNYADFLIQTGFKSIRRPKIQLEINSVDPNFISKLSRIGVDAILFENGSYIQVPQITGLDLFSNEDIHGNYEQKKEGNIIAKVDVTKDTGIKTSIRNYPGWKLWIDGKEEKLSQTENGLFLQFDMSKGTHKVQLRYLPIDLIRGLTISCVILIFLVPIVYLYRRELIKNL